MGFVWCPFCKNPHLLTERTCPLTGQLLPVDAKGKKQSVQIGALVERKYLLKKRLGNGAFGVVYAAENVTLGGQVALKFLGKQSKDAAARFEQEARIANSLQHPNICRVFDSGSTGGGTPFFVMELLTGTTLRSRMERGPIAPLEATGIISQVLSGLGAAHAKGIIHRDIKPENLFLEERVGLEPVAKILHFGLAKAFGQSTKIHTARGMAVGTILYMSPEQVKGNPVGVGCDIFASALVLYEAIAGKHPFRGDSPLETTRRILTDSPVPLMLTSRACPQTLADVVAKGLAKEPADRYATAREFQAALHNALHIVEPSPKSRRPDSAKLPNLAWKDSDTDSENTATIPNAIYRKTTP